AWAILMTKLPTSAGLARATESAWSFALRSCAATDGGTGAAHGAGSRSSALPRVGPASAPGSWARRLHCAYVLSASFSVLSRFVNAADKHGRSFPQSRTSH